MKNNKLLHILLMSGCLVACSDEDDTSDMGQSSVLQADASALDASATPVADAAPVGDGPFEIADCNSPEAGSVLHTCSFAGPESGAEACELVRDGVDLCCCWATETC